MDAGREMITRLESIAEVAAEVALSYYGHVRATQKADKSCVTEADTAIERMLRENLPGIVEGSIVVGEEYVTEDGPLPEWVWVVDPIDGTAVFIDGLPLFCVSIGLARHGQPYAGIVRFPVTGDTYVAVSGSGAWYNGDPVTATGDPARLASELALYVDSKTHREHNIAYPGKIRSLGSTAAHFSLVGRSAGAGAFARGKVWDFFGAAAVLIEAGGEIRYEDGSPIDWPATIFMRELLPQPVLGTMRGRWHQIANFISPLA